MSLLVKMTLSAALVLSIGVPFGAFAAGEKTKGRYKTALGVNVFLFLRDHDRSSSFHVLRKCICSRGNSSSRF